MWQLFPLFKNLHKYCQDRTCMVKNMQNPELSPAASPTVLCQDRAVGLILGAHLLLHVTRSGTWSCWHTALQGSLSWQTSHREPGLGSLCPFPGGEGGFAYFPVEIEHEMLQCDLPCQEGRAGRESMWGKAKDAERNMRLCLPTQGHPCMISCRINSARANSRADTYLWFREIYLC